MINLLDCGVFLEEIQNLDFNNEIFEKTDTVASDFKIGGAITLQVSKILMKIKTEDKTASELKQDEQLTLSKVHFSYLKGEANLYKDAKFNIFFLECNDECDFFKISEDSTISSMKIQKGKYKIVGKILDSSFI